MVAPGQAPTPNLPVTAAQVLDASGPSPAKIPAAGASAPAIQSPEAPKEPAASDDNRVSPKLQVLIQRERAAVERERTAKTREEQLAAREQTLQAREAKLTEFENIKATNPLKALELLQMSYDDLTQVALNDGKVTPDLEIKKVKTEFDSYKKSQEDEKRLQSEEAERQKAKEAETTIAQFRGQISSHLKEQANRYELIAFEESEHLVYDVIDTHFNRTLEAARKKATEEGTDPADAQGEVMTIAQAADKVEEHLEKKYAKARDLAKVKALLVPRQSVSNVAKLQNPIRQTPKTLNNQMSATPVAPRTRPITDDDRIAKAIAYARGLRPNA